jgi:hypothetical protein
MLYQVSPIFGGTFLSFRVGEQVLENGNAVGLSVAFYVKVGGVEVKGEEKKLFL